MRPPFGFRMPSEYSTPFRRVAILHRRSSTLVTVLRFFIEAMTRRWPGLTAIGRFGDYRVCWALLEAPTCQSASSCCSGPRLQADSQDRQHMDELSNNRRQRTLRFCPVSMSCQRLGVAALIAGPRVMEDLLATDFTDSMDNVEAYYLADFSGGCFSVSFAGSRYRSAVHSGNGTKQKVLPRVSSGSNWILLAFFRVSVCAA
jgi:hypothetical protein